MMPGVLMQMLLCALAAALLAVLTTPLVKRFAVQFGVVRTPRARDVHEKPTPLWGGLAMYFAFVLTVLLLVKPLVSRALIDLPGHGDRPILGILIGGTLIAFFGLLDDKYDLSPLKQTGGMLVGALAAALLGVSIKGITNPFAPILPGGYSSLNYIELGVWSVPITMAWMYLVAKTFDFLDGLDGLAAGVCAIASGTIGLLAAVRGDASVALMSAALTGACLGFLRHNYAPASIFMGTVGGQFLGFVLAALSIVGGFKIPATISVAIPLLVLGVPVFDGLFVIGKRLWLRQAPQVADRTSHIHHRLRNRGLSVPQVVWTIYGITASCCLLALLLAWQFSR